ncbi:MAG: outer membrane beta-barrel protein [Bacteroidales bacterium]|nr:outer membrane beta-barrel protein [Bacteroidales bacterium]
MKKIFILFSIQVQLISSIFAQSQIGFKGGFNHSDFFDLSSIGNYSGTYDSDNTFCIGLNYKGRKEKPFNLGFELEYKLKSFDLHASYGSPGFWIVKDAHYDLNFINFSFLPEISYGEKFRVYLNAGPYFGFLVSSDVNGTGYRGDCFGNHSEWIEQGSANKDFGGLDFGIKSGFGIEMLFSEKLAIMIENQLGIGLVNMAKGGFGLSAEFINTKDISISLGLIYKLNEYSLLKWNKKPAGNSTYTQ